MSRTDEVISLYEDYRRAITCGFYSTCAGRNLSNSIGLSDSNITLSKFYEKLISEGEDRFFDILGKEAYQGDDPVDIEDLENKEPELRPFMELMEVISHEVFHGVQKHAYRSIYTLSECLQKIEIFESILFISHASEGGVWKLGDSFLSSLYGFDERSRWVIEDTIADNCQTVIDAMQMRESGLGLLHLIEGQALVASRLATRRFHYLPLPDSPVYSKAWTMYLSSGGSNPMLFVLMAGVALRYGGIGSYSDAVPHPVDIFEYLLHFVEPYERAAEQIEALSDGERTLHARSLSDIFGSSLGFGKPAILPFDKQCLVIRTQFIQEVRDAAVRPVDSVNEDFSYLRRTDMASQSADECEEPDANNLDRFYSTFDEMDEESNDPDVRRGGEGILQISRLLSSVIEETYRIVEEPMKGCFDQVDPENITSVVGGLFSEHFPDFYKDQFVIRTVMEDNFLLGIFGFFNSDIFTEARVQPFSHAEPMSYSEYQSMRVVPEAVRKLLLIAKWKRDGGPTPESPYCCKEHGSPPVEDVDDRFFDKCPHDESVGRAVRNGFNRSVSSLFSGE